MTPAFTASKSLKWFIAVAVLTCLRHGPVLAEVDLIVNGQARAKIYIQGQLTFDLQSPLGGSAPESSKDKKKNKRAPGKTEEEIRQEVEAATRGETLRELNDHLLKMSGTKLTVVLTDNVNEIKEPAIVLGALAVQLGAVPQKTSQSKEGFRILVRDQRVLIGGESEDAVLFGVYELLRMLGCEWVMPGEIGQIVPTQETVKVSSVDISSAPDFLIRRLWYKGVRSKEFPPEPGEKERLSRWLRRQRGSEFSLPVSQTAGHAWDHFSRVHKAEFEKDPTMWALRLDKNNQLTRGGPQIESTHPRVLELFVKDICNTYEKNIAAGKWTRETAAGFPIGPADGLGYSRSKEAQEAASGKIDPATGEPDQTDLLVLLGNRILEQVHPRYPNAYVGFYSYSTHADYPSRYVPNPKMGVIFAPISYSRFHSVIDPNSRTQAWYREVVEKWSALSAKQGNPLLYRGYNWNLAENFLPYTKTRIWGEEIPYYKKKGFLGANVEAVDQWNTLAPGDYILMRLCWDTTLDWRALLRTYCQKAYGKGAAAMEQYWLALGERQSDARQEAGSYHAYHLIYDARFVEAAKQRLAEARQHADSADDRTRIDYVGTSMEALRLYLAYHRKTLEFDFQGAKTAFEAMREQWRQTHHLNPDLVSTLAYEYFKRYLEKFVDEGAKYSAAPYEMTIRIPDELPTAFDPASDGETRKWHEATVNDSSWRKTKTFSTTWDAQGLSDGNRTGSVWYRYRFVAPASMNGKPAGLFLGGFEDEARVWLNGQYIGTSGRRFSNPAAFDLTENLNAGSENVLVLQIIRNSAANELGLGGLIRPGFIFTGPRLETKAPVQGETRRVLPGGELGDVEK
ncbi:MAG TPA: DUF4838 domain-containing protein [Planctomycetota bacterium]|nr:DUF4838 domain-containing protein [Planctomycetota bacterium]